MDFFGRVSVRLNYPIVFNVSTIALSVSAVFQRCSLRTEAADETGIDGVALLYAYDGANKPNRKLNTLHIHSADIIYGK